MLDSLAAVNRQYEEFEPSIEWVHEEECNTLLLFLPGFKKHQLRVQVTKNRKLKISGQRPLGDEKWSRFQKEFQISENCDINGITAKFEGDILYVRQPKVITPAAGQDTERPSGEAPKTDHKPADGQHSRRSSDGQEHAPQQVTSPMPEGLSDPKQINRPKDDDWANNHIPQTKTPQKEKEKGKQSDATTGKSSSISADVKNDSQNEATSEKEKSNELVELGKVANSIKHGKHRDYADSSSAANMNGADSDETHNQISGCLVMELKKRRKMFNFAVAVLLLALVIGLYATSRIGAYKK